MTAKCQLVLKSQVCELHCFTKTSTRLYFLHVAPVLNLWLLYRILYAFFLVHLYLTCICFAAAPLRPFLEYHDRAVVRSMVEGFPE